MSISPARLAANQANALKSTGPKTKEGKAVSRANAVKHGLRSRVVPVADEATIQARAVGVFEMFRPQTEAQAWFCGWITQTTIQLDQVAVIEKEVRDDASHRAATCWSADQAREANRIAARLARQPEQTVGQLRLTVAGCDWLIARWAMLADQARRQLWTDEQKTLAHDLLGTPPEFRAEPPTHQVDTSGKAISPALTELELAQAQLGELLQCRADVSDTDEATRLLATANLNDFNNRDLGRVRCYGQRLWKNLNQAIELARSEVDLARATTSFLHAIPARFFQSPATPPEPDPQVEAEAELAPIAPNEPNPEPELEIDVEAAPIAPNEPNPETELEIDVEVASIAPNEPNPELEVALALIAPNEPNPEPEVELALIAPNEPNPEPEVALAVEVEVAPIAPNEPRPTTTASVAPNEPKQAAPVGPSRFMGPMPDAALARLSPELQSLMEAGMPDPDSLDPAWCRQFVAGRLGIDPRRLMGGPAPSGPFQPPGSARDWLPKST